MSYILEALKKSDKNRKREEIPDLSSDHSFSSPRLEERKIPVWKSIGVLLLVLIVILVSFWGLFVNRPQNERAEKMDLVVKNTPLPGPEKTVAMAPEPKVEISKIVKKAISRIESQAPPEPEEPQKPVEQAVLPSVLPLMEDLPPEIKTAIPDLTFAGHVYAAKSEHRMIMINMRIVREGDMISPGLILQEIVENGVVLRYQEVPFRVRLF